MTIQDQIISRHLKRVKKAEDDHLKRMEEINLAHTKRVKEIYQNHEKEQINNVYISVAAGLFTCISLYILSEIFF